MENAGISMFFSGCRKQISIFLILFAVLGNTLFADSNTAEPYDFEEIPESLQDLRRFEIITFGAMPFVMMDSTLAYSSYRFIKNDFDNSYKPTLFATGNSFTSDEQMKLVLTSLGISAGIGLTDWVVRYIKRTSKRKSEDLKNKMDIDISKVEIEEQSEPIDLENDAVKISLPENLEKDGIK